MTRKAAFHRYQPSASFKPLTVESKSESWLRRNLLSMFSLAISVGALTISLIVEHRIHLTERMRVGAVATVYKDQVFYISALAWYARPLAMASNPEVHNTPQNQARAFSELKKIRFPALTPTTEELAILADTGDDTSQQLALCARWRDKMEPAVEYMATAQPDPPSLVYVLTYKQLARDMPKLFNACRSAGEKLDPYAAPEPSAKNIFDEPVMLRAVPPASVVLRSLGS